MRGRGSSLTTETRLRAGRPGLDPQQGNDGIFLFVIASRPALGPTLPPIQWVQEALIPGVKQPGREADHSLSSIPRLRTRGATLPLPQKSSCGGV